MDPEVSLQSTFPGDGIEPGRYFFARVNTERPPTQNSWALVMIVTEDLMPQRLLNRKGVVLKRHIGAEVFPCWMMGQGGL